MWPRLVGVFGLLALACGTAPTPTESPAIEFRSETGRAVLTVTSTAIVRGVNVIPFALSVDGHPPAALTLMAVPWMPSHGHGATVQPTIEDIGGGAYRATNVVFFMSGLWELRTTLSEEGFQDRVTPSFDVP